MPVEKTKVKSTKPLMEKRRRARINDSLMQLKTLVLDALNKNNPRHSKLEKADILEMTVRYLRTIQRQQISASANSDTTKLDQYRSGYAECVNEVTRYIGATTATDGAPELRTQLVGHLANLCTTRQQPSPTKTSSVSPQHQRYQQSHAVAYQYPTSVRHQQLAEPSMVYPEAPRDSVAVNAMSPSVEATADIPMRYNTVSPIPEGARAEFALTAPVYRNNDTPRVAVSTAATGGPQSPKNSSRLVLSPPVDVSGSLPSGEITLVLPQQALPNGQLPTHFIPVYAQGPTAGSPTTVNANILTDSPPNAGVSSMPSPRTASKFQPIATDVSHRSISPSSAAPTTLSFTPHIQHQTELSPVTREHFAYPKSHMISAASHCATKKESMWRPW